MRPFYTILTNYGKTALAEALAAQQPLKIPYMAVGDGAGEYYDPTETQTNLRNEQWRGDLNDLRTDEELQGQVIAEAIIPHGIDGDWTAREIGLFDGKGGLVAVGKYPETYIPPKLSGAKSQIYINIVVKIDNVAAVELIVNHDTVIASKQYVSDTTIARNERIFTPRPAGMGLTDFVSVKDYGAKGDGVTDDTQAIQAAIDNSENAPAYIPPGAYVISDTLVIGRGKALIGKVPVLRTDLWSTGAILSWGGAVSPRKTMVLLGQNDVGEEPIKDATAVVLENVYLNGNSRIGFLVYGTYLTNDSWVRGVGGNGSTEYNFYFAKAWYASFCNIVSRHCKNNGIALGMPLYYSDGELVKWTSYAPLEMNQCLTDNIRSHAAGQRYSVDAPNTYDPRKSDAMRFSGYGIGAGVGNAFRLNNFLSEQSGGVNLYYYSEWQPSKHVSNGYLEASCLNSGLDAASTLPNIIIDVSVGTNGGGQVIEDLFMNYSSGGIYTVRRGQVYRPVELKRLYQPRFLKDIDGETDIDKPNHPLNFIKMSSVYHQLSGYNFLGKSIVFQKEDVNIRYGYSFSVPCYDTQDYFRVYFRRTSDNWNPSGSIQFELSNGENVSRVWPSEAPKGQWVSLIILGLFSRIKRGGDSGSVDQPVEFKIVRLPSTQP